MTYEEKIVEILSDLDPLCKVSGYMSGPNTALGMIDAIKNGDAVGQQYCDDLIHISVDLLRRRAART